ncbi:MAG: copper homeostasis protein CutC [Coriobacteriaceae bacterium]|nr:copper homeostasis protein CutC [Coriobacteriaceae bacterium]
MLYEFCAENLTDIEAALKAGARRIELCDNLAVGGTTPSVGVIEQAVNLVHAYEGAEVRVIIRPRGGDFAYSDLELRAMETDIRIAAANGADGVVIGCLKRGEDGAFLLDTERTARLIKVAQSVGEMRGRALGITFHMAFDELAGESQLDAIDALAELGVDRILTHGGAAGTPIEGNFDNLRALIERAQNKLVILPGGGITFENAAQVQEALGVRELHGTKIVRLS